MARSPNYPNYDLTASLKHAAKIYSEDGRNKVSRATIATHLGHESLSGPALGKIGALRAYGLVEGSGDELRISEDAIAAIRAPEGSDARKGATARLSLKPQLFEAIRREYPTKPSKDTLTWWLERQGFSGAAAPIAATAYLSTAALVESLGISTPSDSESNGEEIVTAAEKDDQGFAGGKATRSPGPLKQSHIAAERELLTGLLSRGAQFRLLVSGSVGVKEIERLIAKLEIDKEILAEAANEDIEP